MALAIASVSARLARLVDLVFLVDVLVVFVIMLIIIYDFQLRVKYELSPAVTRGALMSD